MGTHCVWICTLPTYSIYRLEPRKIIAWGRGGRNLQGNFVAHSGIVVFYVDIPTLTRVDIAFFSIGK